MPALLQRFAKFFREELLAGLIRMKSVGLQHGGFVDALIPALGYRMDQHSILRSHNRAEQRYAGTVRRVGCGG